MSEKKHFYIGIDGGATKTMGCLEDAEGNVLAEASSGPGNIRLSVDRTWESIWTVIDAMLAEESLSLSDERYAFHVGMGLAGCEVVSAYRAFINQPHPFASFKVSMDSEVACLGAHSGGDGAIIIVGTGVVGWQRDHGVNLRVGGWGFPQDDDGGGAWLGLQAVKMTLAAWDGRLPVSLLSKLVEARFADREALVEFSTYANSTHFATLAPIMIEAANENDSCAIECMKKGAAAIDLIAQTMEKAQKDPAQRMPCALLGGVAPFLMPYLSQHFISRVVPRQKSPEEGAIYLVKGLST